MKAMVMSIKDGKAAVLAHDGTFNEIKDRGYSVGQIMDYKAPVFSITDFVSAKASRIAAAAAVLLLVSTAITATTYGYSTVTLDVNPSLRYDLNVFDRVVDLDSYNEDGEEIVQRIRSGVMGKELGPALDITLDALDDAEYIREDTPVVLTVASHMHRDERLKEKADSRMNDWKLRPHPSDDGSEKKSISPNTIIITRDELKASDKKHESPGRPVLNELKAPADPKPRPSVSDGNAGPSLDPEGMIPGSDPGTPSEGKGPDPSGSDREAPSDQKDFEPSGKEKPDGPPSDIAADPAKKPEGDSAPPSGLNDGNAAPPSGQAPDGGSAPPSGFNDGNAALPSGQAPEGNSSPPSGQAPSGQTPDGNFQPPSGQAPDGGTVPPSGQTPDGGFQPPSGQAPDGNPAPPSTQAPDGGSAPPNGGSDGNFQPPSGENPGGGFPPN